MKAVKIIETKTNGFEYESRHRTDDIDEAISRAIKKHFGSTAFFFANYELNRGMHCHGGYGQIFKPCRVGNGNTSVTGKVRIDIK